MRTRLIVLALLFIIGIFAV